MGAWNRRSRIVITCCSMQKMLWYTLLCCCIHCMEYLFFCRMLYKKIHWCASHNNFFVCCTFFFHSVSVDMFSFHSKHCILYASITKEERRCLSMAKKRRVAKR